LVEKASFSKEFRWEFNAVERVSEWYIFSKKGSSLRQRALYSDDCNRLQQTVTDCNRLQQKEGSSLRQRALHSDDCNRLQQTATYCNILQQTVTDCSRLQQKEDSSLRQRALHSDEKEPYTSSDDQATLCVRSLYLHMHLSMYVSMRICVYWCIHACMHLRVYLCIYASIYLSICVHIYVILSTHWLAAAQPLPSCSELGPYILQNNLSRSKKPHAPCLPPCALVQSVNPYINVRFLLEKSPICIGLFDKRDLAIMSMHGVVGFGYKRVWGSPTLVCVSLGLSCAEPAPVSWAALLLISVSILE